jgi:hypothetical protein
MVEFNPDGSIKLPENMARGKAEKEQKLKSQRCVLFKKEIVSVRPPKKCILHLRISDAFPDSSFVEKLYSYFKEKAEVPTKINRLNEKEFDIEIGTCFSRCSDCTSLIKRFRDFLDGNVIEDKGSCSYERKSKEFCFEDYFD